jgi:hypothetical protein
MTLTWGDRVVLPDDLVDKMNPAIGTVVRTDFPKEGYCAVRVENMFYVKTEDLIPTGEQARLTYMADEAKEQLGGTI